MGQKVSTAEDLLGRMFCSHKRGRIVVACSDRTTADMHSGGIFYIRLAK